MSDRLTRQLAAAVVLDGVPDRIELIPVGTFRTADARGEFHLTNPEEVIRRSLESAPGKHLLIDFGHNVPIKDRGRGDAAGWITDMEVEGERVMASVEWTPAGAEAIRTRAFRFISPVFFNRPDREVVLLGGAGLVNDPGLPQLRQLASREDDTSMDDIKKIAGAMGLGEDATADDVVAAIDKQKEMGDRNATVLASVMDAAGVTDLTEDAVKQLCGRVADEPDPTLYVPRAAHEEVTRQLASLQHQVTESAVEAAVGAAMKTGKLSPAMEAWGRQLASKDMASFEAYVAGAPVLVGGDRQVKGDPPSGDGTLTETERQICAATGVDPERFLATKKDLA